MIFLHILYMYYLCIRYWSSLQCIHSLELWILHTLTDCIYVLLSMVYRYLHIFYSGLHCLCMCVLILCIVCRYFILQHLIVQPFGHLFLKPFSITQSCKTILNTI